MKRRTLFGVVCLLAVTLMGVAGVSAATKKAEPANSLTAAGEKLLAQYSKMLKTLQAEVAKSFSGVDENKKAAFMKAYVDETEKERTWRACRFNWSGICLPLACRGFMK